jgi:phosphatidylserine/phosphatidylglycerophosphate/cardiolipin synthase-like enzyme
MTDVVGTFSETGVGPIVGWTVQLWRCDVQAGWLPQGSASTSPTGSFTISVPILGIFMLSIATVEVRLVDVVGRIVARNSFILPMTGTHTVPPISVVSANLRGWRSTNLDPGGAFPRVSTNNTVEPMTDNATAWGAVHTALTGASHEIALQLFYFDVGFEFLTFTPDPPPVGTPTVGVRLEDDLLAANRDRNVILRLLIRDHSPLPYPIHTADVVVNYFANTVPPSTIEVRRFPTDPRLPMHMKFVVIDGTEAHLTTSPYLQEYFDGPKHDIDEPRRGPLTPYGQAFFAGMVLAHKAWPLAPADAASLASVKSYAKNSIRVPVHDVGARVRGGAVQDIHDTFFLHWNVVGASASSSLTPTPPSAPVSTVQVVRSLPRQTFASLPEGEASILESYLRCFAQATDFIYLENQYLIEFIIYGAIRLALKANPQLQFILLINHKVDIPGYQTWQSMRLNQLKADLTTDGSISRFGAFTLWSYDNTASPPRILPNYVHSKLAIADDHWATFGSANLDGVSLMTGDWLMPIAFTPGLENRREHDINITVFDGLDGLGASTVPQDLRRALWAEHLGLSGPADPLLATRPAAGWLSLWQSQAAAKLNGLKASPPTSSPSRILEWQPQAAPDDYLKALGVDVRTLTVMTEFRGFDFTTGNWQ